MTIVASDFEKYGDYCVIVAYLCNVNEKSSWIYKFFKKTYFTYLNIKSSMTPDFEGEAIWHFAKGYCSCLSAKGISDDDLSMITFEGFKYLRENSEELSAIYQSCIADELQYPDSDYIYDVCEQIFEVINKKLPKKDIAYQFILEELEAASFGNDEAKEFVAKNNFCVGEFDEAMGNSSLEVDGTNGPQQSLTRAVMDLPADIVIKARMRIIVVQKIIDFWFPEGEDKTIDLDDVF